jgi:hypothetical protein
MKARAIGLLALFLPALSALDMPRGQFDLLKDSAEIQQKFKTLKRNFEGYNLPTPDVACQVSTKKFGGNDPTHFLGNRILFCSYRCLPAIQLPPIYHGTARPPPAPNLDPSVNSHCIPEPWFKANSLKPNGHQTQTENTKSTRNTGKENSNKQENKKSLVPTMSENIHRANQCIQEEWNGQRCKPVITDYRFFQ